MTSYARPKAEVIGYTTINVPNIEQYMSIDVNAREADALMEFAGRACYQSFHKPNQATARSADYLRNIINQNHGSVLEHATVSFYLQGISRALTHEFVRHRHFNYSQLSQRFVNESEARIVLPPAVEPGSDEAVHIKGQFDTNIYYYERVVDALLEKGLPRKQAREAARAVLPNSIETKMVVTGNHRSWREFLYRRLDPSADAEIQRLSQLILTELYALHPHLYEDIVQAFGSERLGVGIG